VNLPSFGMLVGSYLRFLTFSEVRVGRYVRKGRIVFPNEEETGGEAVAEILAPWDAVG